MVKCNVSSCRDEADQTFSFGRKKRIILNYCHDHCYDICYELKRTFFYQVVHDVRNKNQINTFCQRNKGKIVTTSMIAKYFRRSIPSAIHDARNFEADGILVRVNNGVWVVA